MGRYAATQLDARQAGNEVAQFVNGLAVARRYEPEERLIPLMMAATAASGRAGDRPPLRALPGVSEGDTVPYDKLAGWVRYFSEDKMWEGIEKCLLTLRGQGGRDDDIPPLLFECAVAPHFIAVRDNLRNLGCLIELLDEFGWGISEELVCNTAAKMLGRGRGVPGDALREAMDIFAETPVPDGPDDAAGDYDEAAFVEGLVSGNVRTTFDAVTRALEEGAGVEQLATSMVMLAADRMARTPVGMSPGWGGPGLGDVPGLGGAHRQPPRRGGGGAQGALPRGLAVLRRPLAQHPPAPPRRGGRRLGQRRPRGGGGRPRADRRGHRVDPGAPHRPHDAGTTSTPATTATACCASWAG